MKTIIRIATPVLAIALMSGVSSFAQSVQPQNNNAAAAQDWNTPPTGTEQSQQGFRDGVQAAQLDRAAKRNMDAKASHLYVHPPVKGGARDEYRASFEAGYKAALEHGSSM
ncbi:MAG TPA: hypothetical protein VGC07_02835 [Granulicella sp.]